jgi:hypothetical protein
VIYLGVTPENSEFTFVLRPKWMGWTDLFEDGDIKYQQEGEGIYIYVYVHGKWIAPQKIVEDTA